MRYLLLFIFMVSFSLCSAQSLESDKEKTNQEWYDYHIEKQKSQKTAALGALAIGLGTIIYGSTESIWGDGTALLALGTVATVGSIYLFSNSSKHKKKAQFYLEQGTVGLNRDIRYSGLSITITF